MLVLTIPKLTKVESDPMKSLISKHTDWYNFVRAYRFYITSVQLTKHFEGYCYVEFFHERTLVGHEKFASCSVAYHTFVKRYGIDSVECVGFIPTRIVGCRYSKAVQQKWGWN